MNKRMEDAARSVAAAFEGFSGRRVLVAGGAGFLGSWVSNVLSLAGAIVVCLDNFSSGSAGNLHERVRVVTSDVETMDGGAEYDYVFHLASRASPEDYQRHQVETLTANSIGTMKALELAGRCGAVLVYSSTSEIYGDSTVVPTPETYWGNVNPVGVRSCYDEGKRFGEAMCMARFREDKVRVRVARIFNSYGPMMRHDGAYGRVVSRFVSQALSNQDVTIYGDGEQTRSFCYATDTVRGLLKLAVAPGVDGGVFNIGDTTEMTVNDVASLIIERTNSRSRVVHLPAQPDDPRRRCPDISKASRVLGWKPEVSFEDGLSLTIDWLRGLLR